MAVLVAKATDANLTETERRLRDQLDTGAQAVQHGLRGLLISRPVSGLLLFPAVLDVRPTWLLLGTWCVFAGRGQILTARKEAGLVQMLRATSGKSLPV